jgi:hypothetical protein
MKMLERRQQAELMNLSLYLLLLQRAMEREREKDRLGRNVFSRDGGKIIKVNTQPPTKLYVPVSYLEAHVEHFWSTIKSIFEAYLDHK